MTILPVAHAALALAALTLGAWEALAIAALFDRYAIPRLEDVAPPGPDDPPLPRLSIIVTAHNEERSMERALRSLLALRYPDYEVVYVNDRSTDRTGEIAERLSDGDARLTVLHIDELPPGWFGKPHAAQRGADAATGEVLLFTDADVTFAHDAAACGVRHLVQQRLDHLTAAPRLTLTGTMLQACTIASRLLVGARQRLWKVRDPRSSAFFGVGSYTIMRADSYRAVGGHERPLLPATGQPLAGLLLAVCPLVYWVVAMTVSRDDSYPWWSALPFPLAVLVFVYALWRSTFLTMFRGVVWGGPPIPLSRLHTARIRRRSS